MIEYRESSNDALDLVDCLDELITDGQLLEVEYELPEQSESKVFFYLKELISR